MKPETFKRKLSLYEPEWEDLIKHLNNNMEEEITFEFETKADAINHRARLYRYCALLKENEDKIQPELFLAATNTMVLLRHKKIVLKHRYNSPYRKSLRKALERAGGDLSIIDPFLRMAQQQSTITQGITQREHDFATRVEERKASNSQAPQLGFGKIDPDALEREQEAERIEAEQYERAGDKKN